MLKMAVAAVGGALLLGAGTARPASAMTDDVVVRFKAMGVNQPGLLEIRSSRRDGPAAIVLATPQGGGELTQAQLLFDDVGSDKFLRAIVLPDREGAQLPASRAEVLAAREVAAKAVEARSHR
jgi:hypothetical protein